MYSLLLVLGFLLGLIIIAFIGGLLGQLFFITWLLVGFPLVDLIISEFVIKS